MRRARVFNLTDVPTPELERKGWLGVVVGGTNFSVRPGESVEVLLRPDVLHVVQDYVNAGVLAVDTLPVAYVVRKNRRGSQ